MSDPSDENGSNGERPTGRRKRRDSGTQGPERTRMPLDEDEFFADEPMDGSTEEPDEIGEDHYAEDPDTPTPAPPPAREATVFNPAPMQDSPAASTPSPPKTNQTSWDERSQRLDNEDEGSIRSAL